jgi:hypothetical protein
MSAILIVLFTSSEQYVSYIDCFLMPMSSISAVLIVFLMPMSSCIDCFLTSSEQYVSYIECFLMPMSSISAVWIVF